ncbi:MAG: endonuclease/exonuclease/phosphatase family protein [Pirellulaceae bacterium]
MRGLVLSFLSLVLGFVCATGCNVDVDQVVQQLEDAANQRSGTGASGGRAVLADDDTISIAAFNIQVFGQSKLGKPDVMEVLSNVVRQFDVIAVQELRSAEQNVIPEWLEMINADGSRYDGLVGPRLGRTNMKEQYVYLYNTETVEMIPGSHYTVNDPEEVFHRAPLVASFQTKVASGENPFTFTLVNIHTSPDEVDWELDALGDTMHQIQQANPNEDDVIVLGDLNVDYRNMGRLAQIPNVHWIVNEEPTNTRKTATYDNIVFDKVQTNEYVGSWGILDLESQFGLTLDEALDVSDHLPVWAAFTATEQPSGTGPVASHPAATRR